MKHVNGVWSPDEIKTRWLEGPFINGLPSYQYDDIQQVVQACGKRLNVAIDGGACVGIWTIHLARYFKRVIAFEPIPHIFACLEKNTEVYGPERGSERALDLYRAALSDKVSQLAMTPRAVGWAAHPHTKSRGEPQYFPCMTVDSLKLDQLDLLKLDLEGHEYAGLLGARETIIRCKPFVIVEEKLDKMKRAIGFLTDLGMTCTSVQNGHDYFFRW